MATPKSNASQECPFLALQPVIVLDEVCVCENRVEREEGHGVEMCPPWKAGVQVGPSDFGRINSNGDPKRKQMLAQYVLRFCCRVDTYIAVTGER